jgi:TonB-linked SusC/RagA family outer membrane protein
MNLSVEKRFERSKGFVKPQISQLVIACLIFLFSPLWLYAQSETVTIHQNDVALEKVLNAIEQQTSYRFLYNKESVDVGRHISVDSEREALSSVLTKLFDGSDVGYKVVGKQIVLNNEKTNPQFRVITGVVKDEAGEPVIGASVAIRGTGKGTITDLNGAYQLEVPAKAVLQYSSVGMTTVQMTVTNQSVLNVTMKEEATSLDEVVVVGYGTQKKRDLTGAVSSVKLSDEPITTFSTVSHALAGKAAGLRATQSSAQVGGGVTFQIRGATSTGAGNDPLIIIDGFPVTSSKGASGKIGGTFYDAGTTDNVLGSLNPNDIESIEVLKDASATAIYGSRAGHGVIIVTTKRGKQGDKLKVNYSGNFGVTNLKNDYKMMNTEQFFQSFEADLKEKYMAANGLGVYAAYRTPTGKTLDEFDPMGTATYKKSYDAWVANGKADTGWVDEVTRTGIQQTHNVSLRSGTENTQFFTSLNYFDQDGIIKNNGMNRLTAVVNLDQKISDYVKGGISLNISRNNYENSSFGNTENEGAGVLGAALRFTPTIPVYDADGNLSVDPIKSDFPNPVSLLEITDKTTQDRVLGSAYVAVNPIKELTLKANLGMDRKYYKRKQYIPSYIEIGKGSGGQAIIQQEDDIDYLMELTATYAKTFGSHNLTALVGYSYQQFNNEGFSAGGKNFPLDTYLYNNISTGALANRTVSSWATKSALGSYFGRVNYTFMDRYLLTATLRADGDSDFLPANRWGYFPSASVGWRFTEEDFIKPLTQKIALTSGKLRASYGQTGNSNIGNKVYDAYGTSGMYVYGNNSVSNGMAVSKLGNPAITWETTTEFNLGLDLGFFDGRINLSAEYYNRVISDLLSSKSLPSYNEITSVAANIGKTQGQGVEITLNTVNVRTKDLTWSTDFTLQHYEDRWKERDPDWTPAVYQNATDYIRYIYVMKSDGLMQVGEQAPAWQPNLLPGQIKVKNLADEEGVTNKLDQNDVYLLGTTDPQFIFGLNNTLRYKNFDLNIYLYGELNRWRGQSYYEAWSGGVAGSSVIYNAATSSLNQWSSTNQTSKLPSVVAVSNSLPYGTDYWYKKVSYLRCRNITLGYSFKLPKAGIGNARVYLDVNNPFLLTNWTGIDPETDPNDGKSYSHPSVSGFNVGIDITF